MRSRSFLLFIPWFDGNTTRRNTALADVGALAARAVIINKVEAVGVRVGIRRLDHGIFLLRRDGSHPLLRLRFARLLLLVILPAGLRLVVVAHADHRLRDICASGGLIAHAIPATPESSVTVEWADGSWERIRGCGSLLHSPGGPVGPRRRRYDAGECGDRRQSPRGPRAGSRSAPARSEQSGCRGRSRR